MNEDNGRERQRERKKEKTQKYENNERGKRLVLCCVVCLAYNCREKESKTMRVLASTDKEEEEKKISKTLGRSAANGSGGRCAHRRSFLPSFP